MNEEKSDNANLKQFLDHFAKARSYLNNKLIEISNQSIERNDKYILSDVPLL